MPARCCYTGSEINLVSLFTSLSKGFTLWTELYIYNNYVNELRKLGTIDSHHVCISLCRALIIVLSHSVLQGNTLCKEGCVCSEPHAHFILYMYGICHTHVHIWHDYTCIVQPYMYGMSFLIPYGYQHKYTCKWLSLSITICCVHIMKIQNRNLLILATGSVRFSLITVCISAVTTDH